MDQTQFDFPLDDLKRKRRRQAKPARPKAAAKPVPTQALVESPWLQRCGFCGHGQTVLGESTLCDDCGGIIIRDESVE